MIGASHQKNFSVLFGEYYHRFINERNRQGNDGADPPDQIPVFIKGRIAADRPKAYIYLSNLNEAGDIEKTLFRHNQILAEVSRYMESNSHFFLEGFLRFRLKEYF